MKTRQPLGASTIYYEWRHPLSNKLIRTLSYTLRNVSQADHTLAVERFKQHLQYCAGETSQTNETPVRTLWLGAAWKGPVA